MVVPPSLLGIRQTKIQSNITHGSNNRKNTFAYESKLKNIGIWNGKYDEKKITTPVLNTTTWLGHEFCYWSKETMLASIVFERKQLSALAAIPHSNIIFLKVPTSHFIKPVSIWTPKQKLVQLVLVKVIFRTNKTKLLCIRRLTFLIIVQL